MFSKTRYNKTGVQALEYILMTLCLCISPEARLEVVKLAQQVKASVGQADIQIFEPHLQHNWLA